MNFAVSVGSLVIGLSSHLFYLATYPSHQPSRVKVISRQVSFVSCPSQRYKLCLLTCCTKGDDSPPPQMMHPRRKKNREEPMRIKQNQCGEHCICVLFLDFWYSYNRPVFLRKIQCHYRGHITDLLSKEGILGTSITTFQFDGGPEHAITVR